MRQCTRTGLALDCGDEVNPDQIAAQMEGSVAYGLSPTFHESVSIKDGGRGGEFQ